jgi:hypothetical protein
MIKLAVSTQFPHQYVGYVTTTDSFYIADYTEQTKTSTVKRGVEFHLGTAPADNVFFTLTNNIGLEIGGIPFDNSSFICGGNPRSQCECVVFPHDSTTDSWVLFSELKYCQNNTTKNSKQIKKAIRQLYRTRHYYVQHGIITKQNTSYLIVSLPLQNVPFKGFTPTPAQLIKLKRDRNIILAFRNNSSVIDQKLLSVV